MRLSGKNCLITGASSGLGLCVSTVLGDLGANTILLCRNQEKGENAVLEIKKENPNAEVELMICDLSSMKSSKSFIEEFKGKYSKLDILYNNATVMKQKRTVTEDGFEMMFQVNYLAPFIRMNSFLELLKNGSSPHIINNGRPVNMLRLNMDDLQFRKNYSMYRSFLKTKLCLLFASLELSRKQASNGITVTTIDPGSFLSDLVKEAPSIGWVKNLLSFFVYRATYHIIHHITSDDIKNKNGRVFKKKSEKPLTEYWKDRNVSGQLWSVTESLINNI
ncbi:hypothetical protein BVY01_03150 [bacterium I07]|nr:hypothetical protein BVY01_03150 [bacterium I07]